MATLSVGHKGPAAKFRTGAGTVDQVAEIRRFGATSILGRLAGGRYARTLENTDALSSDGGATRAFWHRGWHGRYCFRDHIREIN